MCIWNNMNMYTNILLYAIIVKITNPPEGKSNY